MTCNQTGRLDCKSFIKSLKIYLAIGRKHMLKGNLVSIEWIFFFTRIFFCSFCTITEKYKLPLDKFMIQHLHKSCFSECSQFSQFSRSVVSDSSRPYESQHARPPCPSPTPGVHSDSRLSSQ